MVRKPNNLVAKKILFEVLNHPNFIKNLPNDTLENNQLLGAITINNLDLDSMLSSTFINFKTFGQDIEEKVTLF